MLIWKAENFKILIVGGSVEVIPIVERRIGQVISLPIEIHSISFEELEDDTFLIPAVDLILVERVNQHRFNSLFQLRFFSTSDFIPSLIFHLTEKETDDEIEFCP